MIEPLLKNGSDMIVCQRVENGFAFPAVFNQFALLQHAQLMGYGRLAHTQYLRNIANTKLRLKQSDQYSLSCGFSENFD